MLAAIRGLLLLALMAVSVSTTAADVSIRLSDIDASLDRIAEHAKQYPPRFSSPEERERTEQDLKNTIKLLDTLTARYPNNPDLLLRKGMANAMGHNFDYPGCAEKAIAAFEKSISLDPNNARTLYEYGGFLAGTKLFDKSIPYLEKAIQLGEERAHYPLAFVYIKKHDPGKALPEFQAYLKSYPDDPTAKKMVSNIESGKLDVHVETK